MDTTFLTTSQHKLLLPTGIRDQAISFVQKQAADSAREASAAPFRRLVDFWFMAVVVAVSRGMAPSDVDGEAFVSIGPTSKDVKLDGSLRELLVLIAVWHLRPTRENVPTAGTVVGICNRFAASGAHPLLMQLRDGVDRDADFQVPSERLAGIVKALLEKSDGRL
jgi:hypothetical protein